MLMVIFGSLGLLNRVKEESPHMQSFVTFLLEQESHKIVSGDTLGGIARKYGTTTKELQRLNNIEDPNKISAGASIRLPGKPKQEKPELPADLLKGGSPSSRSRSQSPTRQTNTRQQSPFETGVRRAVGQVAKIRDEYDDLMPDLEYEEGYREFAYPDPKNPETGPITVGIGSTRTREAEQVLRDRGLDPNRVFTLNQNRQQGVSKDVAKDMALSALQGNEGKLRQMYPTFDQESSQTRNVLRSMAFNMGTGNIEKQRGGLAGFKKMNAAVTSGDTEAQRREALDSRRARQIPRRARREAEMMVPRPRKDETTGRYYSPLPPQ